MEQLKGNTSSCCIRSIKGISYRGFESLCTFANAIRAERCLRTESSLANNLARANWRNWKFYRRIRGFRFLYRDIRDHLSICSSGHNRIIRYHGHFGEKKVRDLTKFNRASN